MAELVIDGLANFQCGVCHTIREVEFKNWDTTPVHFGTDVVCQACLEDLVRLESAVLETPYGLWYKRRNVSYLMQAVERQSRPKDG
jgi:hypothetical protein